MTERSCVTLYTDGACSGNPGPGGWAAVLMYGGTHSFTDKNLSVAGFGAKTAASDIAGMEL